jgi:hypothetical protein
MFYVGRLLNERKRHNNTKKIKKEKRGIPGKKEENYINEESCLHKEKK